MTQFDSGMLQFAPKGSYYEGKDQQFTKVFTMWKDLFKHDRVLFALTSILSGTRFSKGMMSHMLLSNIADKGTGKDLAELGITDSDFERNVILYNLYNESMPNALKNLLILAGSDTNAKAVNNSRTRKIILEYIFARENHDLDSMAVNFKGKMATLVRHALGKQDTHHLIEGYISVFNKFIAPHNKHAWPVICHLFNTKLPFDPKNVQAYFPKIERYWALSEAAKNQDVDEFRKLMKGMPHLTVMGFRNTYKVPIDKSEVYDTSTKSTKQSIQMESAAKRSGTKVKVNYKNQDIYDLWKAIYNKMLTADDENVEKLFSAVSEKKVPKVNLGPTSVVVDTSRSMMGTTDRPLHPFLTTLCLISTLDNVRDVIYTGGSTLTRGNHSIKVPSGHTNLWKGLLEAAKKEPKTIVVISDGYENSVQGAFEHVHSHLKKRGHQFDLLHINPVFSADAKKGSARMLVKDLKPLPVTSYKFFETEFIFNRMIENTDIVKRMLASKYQKMIEGRKSK